MPYEVRDIVFSKEEVAAALCAHDRMCGEQEIQGAVADVRVENGDDVNVKLSVEGADESQIVTVGGDKLLAALIRYCIENNIVIPRRSKKSVLPAADAARLRIEVGAGLPTQTVDLD